MKIGLFIPRNVGSYSKMRDLLSLVGGMFSMEEKVVSVKIGQDKLRCTEVLSAYQ